MEIILVILFVVLALASASDKNKKKRQSAGQPHATAARQAAHPGTRRTPFGQTDEALERRPQPTPQAPARDEPVARPVRPAVIRKSEPLPADPECAGGSTAHAHGEGHSALEDEDCVGGSMAHSHTEGVSRADHARRMAAIDADRVDAQVLPGTIDARALRHAVVMAEVLGKPKALRKSPKS